MLHSCPVMNDLEKLRHSAAHVMADAVQRLWPEAKLTIGPPIETGFYYDFDIDAPVHRRGPRRDRGADGRDRRAPTIRSSSRRSRATRRSTTSSERNEPYKVELAQRHPRGRAHHAALARRVHRSLPRRPLQVDRRDQGLQAALGRRRLLARRLTQQDAPAHLRHRVPRRRRSSTSTSSSSRRRRSATTASSARSSASSRSTRGRRARPSGCRAARSLYNTLSRVHARACSSTRRATSRSRRRSSSTRSCGRRAGHWQHYAENMFQRRVRGAARSASSR